MPGLSFVPKLPLLSCLFILMAGCAELEGTVYETLSNLPEPEPQLTAPQGVKKPGPAKKRFANLEADDDDGPSTNPGGAGGANLGGAGGSGLSSQGSGSWDG